MFKKLLPTLLVCLVTMLFFYKTFLHGFVPFPGDLLISEYNPWKTYSYLGYNPGSFPNKAQYFDVIRQLYPWKTLVVSQVKQGQFPLWNPYNFSGAPLFANFQSSVLYPLSFVYYLFPQITAWSLLIILQPFLACLFTYFYCKKIGITKISSLFAGITFGFSSFMSVWLEYNTLEQVILWFPLILLAVEYIRKKDQLIWDIVLAIGLVSSALGGHLQIFGYVFLFSFIYGVLRVGKNNIKNVIVLFAISLGIAAVQLLPGLELVVNSARTSFSSDFFYNKILVQWWQLIMGLVPDFFGNPATRNYWVQDTFVGDIIYFGVIPLLLIPFAVKSFTTNIFSKLFTISSILLLLLTTSNPISFFFYKLPIPFIAGSGANLVVFLLIFSCSILAGIGLDTLRKKKASKLFYCIFASIPVLLLATVELLIKQHMFTWSSNLTLSIKPIEYSSVILYVSLLLIFLARKTKLQNYIIVFLLLIQIADLFRFFTKFNPFVPVVTVFPKAQVAIDLKKTSGINRYFSYGNAYIEANFDTQLGLFSPNGYDPLYPRTYGQFVNLSKDGTLATTFDITTRSDAVISQNVDKNSLKVLNLLGVASIVNRPVTSWKISPNKDALPRFFLTSGYQIYSSDKGFETLFSKSDLRQTILLSEKPSMTLQQDNNAKVQLVSYAPEKITFQANSKTNQLLFLSDSYYPGWKAYVDGVETKIYQADFAFRAVGVPKGNHSITFLYDPLSFEVGKWITFVSLGIFAVFAWLVQYNNKR